MSSVEAILNSGLSGESESSAAAATPPSNTRAATSNIWDVGFDYSSADEYKYESDAVLAVAQYNYKTFYNLRQVPTIEILHHTSAGIHGWASCVLTKSRKQDKSCGKRKFEAESMDSANTSPTLSPSSRRRKGDAEEDRELQLALLESLGVNVGKEAKKSVMRSVTLPEIKAIDEVNEEEEEIYSVEDDGLLEEVGLESVSIQSSVSKEQDGNMHCGLSPLAAGMTISTYLSGENTNSDDSGESFVVVHRRDSSLSDSSSNSTEIEASGETGLSPLARDLTLDSSEDESQESFVAVSLPMQKNGSSDSQDDWSVV